MAAKKSKKLADLPKKPVSSKKAEAIKGGFKLQAPQTGTSTTLYTKPS